MPLAGDKGSDPSVCGRTLHVYNYWEKSGRILDVTFGKGTMQEAPFPPYGSYSYASHPESGDLIESRKTTLVDCASPAVHYAGTGWAATSDPLAYQGQVKQCSAAGNSLQFSF